MYTMDELKKYCLKCHKCRLATTRTNVVFGEGNEKADIMFVGEGPGYYEDIQGRPFVGKAGQLLDKMFEGIHLTVFVSYTLIAMLLFNSSGIESLKPSK
jgi:DNA polymerase